MSMNDAINLSTAILTPDDVRGFPVTTAITALLTGPGGLNIQFSKKDGSGWPDIKPESWDGPVYYTVFIGAALGDGVHLSACLNVFRGEGDVVGGDVTNLTMRSNPAFAQGKYAQDLWYLDGALAQHAAVENETLYLMVVAGGWRGVKALSVAERSNVVAFQASSMPRTFTFSDVPTPVPDPTPDPTPVPSPTPDPIAAILSKLNDLELAVLKLIDTPPPAPTPVPAPLPPPIYDGSVRLSLFGVSTFTMTPRKP